MLEILLGAGAAAAVAAGGTLAFRLQRRWWQRIERAWVEAARLAGGRFEPAVRKLFGGRRARILARLEPGVDVIVDHYTVSTGKNEAHFTRLRASAPGAGDFELKLRRENALTQVGKALGLGDIQLGDPPFDDRYLVRSGDPWMTRAWLDAGTRAAFLAAPVAYDGQLVDGEVTVRRHGLERDAAALHAAMRAAAALAAGGLTLARRWQELARELGATSAVAAAFAPGAMRFEAEHEGRRFAVETTADRDAGTRVRRELPAGGAPQLEVAPGAPLGEVAAGAPAAEAAWQAVQPAHLTCDGRVVELGWPGYVPDAARCRAAFTLLAAIRTNAGDAYR